MTSKRRKRRQSGKRKEFKKEALKTWDKLNYVPPPDSIKSWNGSWDGLVRSIVDVQPMSGLPFNKTFKQLYMNEWTEDERNENTNNPT